MIIFQKIDFTFIICYNIIIMLITFKISIYYRKIKMKIKKLLMNLNLDYWLHLTDFPSPHLVIKNPNNIKIHNKILKQAVIKLKFILIVNIEKLKIFL